MLKYYLKKNFCTVHTRYKVLFYTFCSVNRKEKKENHGYFNKTRSQLQSSDYSAND